MFVSYVCKKHENILPLRDISAYGMWNNMKNNLSLQAYLNTGTGYDCAGQNMLSDVFTLASASLRLSPTLILGRTLATGSMKREASKREAKGK